LLHDVMNDVFEFPRAAVDAWRGETIRLASGAVQVPGTRRIRLSVVAGNLRIHRLLDRFVEPGATVVDVGANIGYNTLHAARRAGARGRVVAVEPAPDNLAVLRRNVAGAGLGNVGIEPVAAGRNRGTCELFLRGAVSAVNILFRESCYAAVTGVIEVPIAPLDELVDGPADVVKIDVEGAELDVLEGMARLLAAPRLVLIVEWHPRLQQLAGYVPDALPRWLLTRGFELHAASHVTVRPLAAAGLAPLTARLERLQRPVELLARRRGLPPRVH
jgi:FkbM family methyltransferase